MKLADVSWLKSVDVITSVFDGTYVTGDITEEYLAELEQQRNDAAKRTNDVASHINRNLTAQV